MAEQLESEIRQLYEDWIARPSAVVCARLADRLRLAGRNDEALEVARRGLSDWPTNSSIRVVAARCLKGSGDSQAAKEAFESVLVVDPLNLIALRNLAEIAMEQGRYDDTVRLFGDYLFENPGDQEAERLFEQAKKLQRQSAAATPAAPAAIQIDIPTPVPGVEEADPESSAAAEEQEEPPVVQAEETVSASIEELPSSESSEPSEIETSRNEEPPAAFPQTDRMDKILRDQGVSAAVEETQPPTPEPRVEPAPAVSKPQSPGLKREPRSLFDLFSPEERAELFLEPYSQEEK